MKGRVRVVHLVSALNVGGLEKVVFDLTRLTDRNCFAPRVLCLREPGELAASPLNPLLYSREV